MVEPQKKLVFGFLPRITVGFILVLFMLAFGSSVIAIAKEGNGEGFFEPFARVIERASQGLSVIASGSFEKGEKEVPDEPLTNDESEEAHGVADNPTVRVHEKPIRIHGEAGVERIYEREEDGRFVRVLKREVAGETIAREETEVSINEGTTSIKQEVQWEGEGESTDLNNTFRIRSHAENGESDVDLDLSHSIDGIGSETEIDVKNGSLEIGH